MSACVPLGTYTKSTCIQMYTLSVSLSHTHIGSTGSRVHVYRWVWRGDDKLPTITDDFFKQVCYVYVQIYVFACVCVCVCVDVCGCVWMCVCVCVCVCMCAARAKST